MIMTSKERVIRAIEFRVPDKTPIYLFNKDIDCSDIVNIQVGNAQSFQPESALMTEWGYEWERVDKTMGQPKDCVIKEWSDLKNYKAPNAFDKSRFIGFPNAIQLYKDKFIMAGIGISGFTTVTFIRGFENVMADFYEERENLEKLIDIVFEYENNIIAEACKFDIDAFTFYDDWGAQKCLLINPKMWEEIFLPRYKKQFDILHSHNKKIYFHSCGYVYDIIDSLIAAGVDVFNFNQPDVMGIENLKKFKGKVAFNCPVDLQKVAITGTKDEIFNYTQKLKTELGTFNGGFIGYVEEYSSIGLSDQNYNYCIEALKNL